MRVIITGIAGFIGSHLAQELLKEDVEIIGIDNLSSGLESNLKLLKELDKDNKITFHNIDIRDLDAMKDAVKDLKVDSVFHLAALVSVQESIDNPLKSGSINIAGTQNVLELARYCNAKRIMFSSSAAVYGDEPTLPKNENSIVKPISPYGMEKYVGEQYMKIYSDLYGLEAVVFRYFNVYGERQNPASDYSGVISIFNDRLKKNEGANIYGDGEQYRDFVYVKDVVKANILAMKKENLKYEVFCVGTGAKTTVNELYEALKNRYNSDKESTHLEARVGDIKESVCDNSKIVNVLGLKEFTPFAEGIYKV